MEMFKSVVSVSLLTVGICSACTSVNAQNPDQTAAYWLHIQNADKHINKIQVTWSNCYIRLPAVNANAEKLNAMAREHARLEATSPANQLILEQVNAQIVQHSVHGKTWQSRVTFLYDGKTVRAEVLDGIDKQPELMGHVIDVYDGANMIHVTGLGPQTPTHGQLYRSPEDKLSFSAPGPVRPLFLFASPLTAIFKPESTTLREGPGDSIILEHTIPFNYPLLSTRA